MRTIVLTVVFGALSFLNVTGQNNLHTTSDDTLTFLSRTGGNIDTFDLAYSFPLSTLPGGTINQQNAAPSIDFFKSSPSLFLYAPLKNKPIWKVSGLPHVGFFYSFGTKGIQFLHADYEQTFRNKSLLNLTIDRSSSSAENSMIRNGGFSNQNFQAAYRFGTKKLKGHFNGKYSQNTLRLNGGISNDSSWITRRIAFAPVFKPNATSLHKRVNVYGELKYSLLKDSSRSQLGLISKHYFSIWNREYNESDTLAGIYSTINIDSSTTRDQFQDAKFKNSIGIFGESNQFSASVFVSHRYWRLQNLGRNRDTNEISTEFNFGFNQKKLSIESTNYFNIIGAKNEYSSQNSIKWGGIRKYLAVSAAFESMLPSLVQRFYFANNLNYSNQLDKQGRADLFATGCYSFWKIDGSLTFGSLTWKNNLVWENENWKIGNESNRTINYIKAKIHFDFNWLHLYPELRITNGSDYLPKTFLSGRLLVKKKVFAAKKLELMFALDPQLCNKYKLMSYNTLLDNWYFDSSNRSGGQVFTLHSTFALHIEEFKFFIRIENLQAIWTARNIEIAQNYYRPTFLLRLGVSWDFFN